MHRILHTLRYTTRTHSSVYDRYCTAHASRAFVTSSSSLSACVWKSFEISINAFSITGCVRCVVRLIRVCVIVDHLRSPLRSLRTHIELVIKNDFKMYYGASVDRMRRARDVSESMHHQRTIWHVHIFSTRSAPVRCCIRPTFVAESLLIIF